MTKARLAPPTPLPGQLTRRTLNALARHGITSVEQVKAAYPEGLLRLSGFGLKALRDVEKALFPWKEYMPTRLQRNVQSAKKTNRFFFPNFDFTALLDASTR